MKVGYLQFAPYLHQPKKNLELILSQLENISADLIVLPELALTGYLFESKKQLAKLSEEISVSKVFDELKIFSEKKKLTLVIGFSEKCENDIFNSAAIIQPGNLIRVYRKTHLFDSEKMLFTPGNTGFKTFTIENTTVGVMICFDWAFPEAARTLALMGADVIAHPSNLVLNYCQEAMITRSIENHIFTITANRIGTETLQNISLNFTGQSQIISPKGEIINRDKPDKPNLFLTEINITEAKNKNITENNHLIEDRRPEFYF